MKKLSLFILIIALLVLVGCAPTLHDAAAKGDIKTLKELLDKGADINKASGREEWAPVVIATNAGHADIVKLLLDRGADLDIAGGQALAIAANKGYTGIVKLLLEKGVKQKEHFGLTPLHYAASAGYTDIAKLLIENGANVNAINESGYTPLSVAAYSSHTDTIKALIEKGADKSIAIAVLRNHSIKYPRDNVAKKAIEYLENLDKRQEIAIQSIIPESSFKTLPAIQSDIDKPLFNTIERIISDRDIAVVIGIEKYQGLPKSDFSKKDANLVKNYLKALGFAERNIELITDEKATKSSIEKSLEAWLPNRIKKDSRVFVYYSGHGAPEPKTGDAYIVPYDGDPNYLQVTGYSLKRLYDNLGKLQVKEVTVVLDSCFSGAGGRSVLAKGARPLVMMTDLKVIPSNMAILSATQGTQISTSSTEKRHGVFTYYFLKALKEGKKSIAEIYEYIKPLVEDEAKQLNVQQSPSISPDAEKIKGRFILRR